MEDSAEPHGKSGRALGIHAAVRRTARLPGELLRELRGYESGRSGTFFIPQSQSQYPIPAFLATDFANDNITIRYTSNRSLVNPDHHEIAPRIGISYQPKKDIVVRAGFGIFYGGQENIGLGLNLYNNPPFFLTSNFNPTPNQCYNTVATGVVCPTNGQTLETGFGAAATSNAGLEANAQLPTLFEQDQNAKSTYTEAYNLTLQQSLTSTISRSPSATRAM